MPRRPDRRPQTGGMTQRLVELAMNLAWTWHAPTQRLFAGLEPRLWELTNHNPIATLQGLDWQRRAAIEQDPKLVRQLVRCEVELARSLSQRTWFDRRRSDQRPLVAYFCAEYALHECLPQYAGGLGVLAGDHLKSASDLGIHLIAIGLFYRNGYCHQQIDSGAQVRASWPVLDPARLPMTDTGKQVSIPMGRRTITARLWCVQVGRVGLYLLDTDVKANRPADRTITDQLYAGDSDRRIRQEIVLGIGGLRALEALSVQPTVFHLNEGHAAFCGLGRLQQLQASGCSLDEARRIVRRSTVFTTHTHVPAGHDRFEPTLAWRYLGPLAGRIGLTRHELLAMGRQDPSDANEPLCMTVLALKLAAHCNGVSKLHGEVSRRMWQPIYGAAEAADVPIGHVTNGIHPQTWLAELAEPLYRRYLRPRWNGLSPGYDFWRHADQIDPAELWLLRGHLRRQLVHFVRQRLVEQILRRGGSPVELTEAQSTFDEHTLTIGFARRFAAYKRATLIFQDSKRLQRILGHPDRPVQIVFAGKAHPKDTEGQKLLKGVFRAQQRSGLRGRVALIEEFDMHVGRMLVSGVDLWLNNPLRPNEASGTSGMKPPLHGGINCSILDGWWPQAYDGNNGFQIGGGRRFATRRQQDRYDASALYALLEQRIVPMFYRHDRKGVPRQWMKMAIASMKSVCGRFHSHRMLGAYLKQFYLPAHCGQERTGTRPLRQALGSDH